MNALKDATDYELVISILESAAKAKNEIACAQRDLEQASNRERFILLLVNELKDRYKGD